MHSSPYQFPSSGHTRLSSRPFKRSAWDCASRQMSSPCRKSSFLPIISEIKFSDTYLRRGDDYQKAATIISKRETVISAPDAVMSGPHIIIHRRDAIMSALETVICAAATSIYRAEIAISAFGTSFLAAEISISAAVKTTGAAPECLFPPAPVSPGSFGHRHLPPAGTPLPAAAPRRQHRLVGETWRARPDRAPARRDRVARFDLNVRPAWFRFFTAVADER